MKLTILGLILFYILFHSCSIKSEKPKSISRTEQSLKIIETAIQKYLKQELVLDSRYKVYNVYFQSCNNGIMVNICPVMHVDTNSLLKASEIFILDDELFLMYLPVEFNDEKNKKKKVDSIINVFNNKSIFIENQYCFDHALTKSFLIMDDSLILDKNYIISEDQSILFKDTIKFQSPNELNNSK